MTVSPKKLNARCRYVLFSVVPDGTEAHIVHAFQYVNRGNANDAANERPIIEGTVTYVANVAYAKQVMHTVNELHPLQDA